LKEVGRIARLQALFVA
jgi:hypothetical protein